MNYNDLDLDEIDLSNSDKPMLDIHEARKLTQQAKVSREQKEYARQINKVIDCLYDAVEGGLYEFQMSERLLPEILLDLNELGYLVEFIDKKGIGMNFYRVSWEFIEEKPAKKKGKK